MDKWTSFIYGIIIVASDTSQAVLQGHYSQMKNREMTSRERVMQSLDHNESERVPIDPGATIVSSIVKQTYIELKQHLGMPVEEIKMLNNVQQLPYVDDE